LISSGFGVALGLGLPFDGATQVQMGSVWAQKRGLVALHLPNLPLKLAQKLSSNSFAADKW